MAQRVGGAAVEHSPGVWAARVQFSDKPVFFYIQNLWASTEGCNEVHLQSAPLWTGILRSSLILRIACNLATSTLPLAESIHVTTP